MTLIPLPAFNDNYIWMLHDGHGALVVDPGDAQPVLRALSETGLQLHTILVTHHHADHTGGIQQLFDATGATVYGPAREQIAGVQHGLKDGDQVCAMGLDFQVLDVPGHTAGHIAYFCTATPQDPILFCGDTLFSGGCGRLFEGTPDQMLASLERLAGLPGHTRVCCTHEYTLSNLKFAREVDPDNQALVEYQQHCQALRAAARPTLPSTIAQELKINPFLRSHDAALIRSARRFDAASTVQHGAFATLRQWKNQYQ
ncbi:MAG: hydroxyacylglutathione hydrolase [Rhodoferax sp.]|nr:hydroxyacylglutathione hydrolase [Rhodoferax sp.]